MAEKQKYLMDQFFELGPIDIPPIPHRDVPEENAETVLSAATRCGGSGQEIWRSVSHADDGPDGKQVSP